MILIQIISLFIGSFNFFIFAELPRPDNRSLYDFHREFKEAYQLDNTSSEYYNDNWLTLSNSLECVYMQEGIFRQQSLPSPFFSCNKYEASVDLKDYENSKKKDKPVRKKKRGKKTEKGGDNKKKAEKTRKIRRKMANSVQLPGRRKTGRK